jgi:undecaprenyl-diphosphatase
MTIFTILILAVVQGVTEFLPVSSSGHLVVAEALFQSLGWGSVPEKLEVNIALHVGTLVSVLIYYWRDIVRVLTTDRRAIGLIIVGSIPAGIIGVGIKVFAPESVENMLTESALFAGSLFPVTALLLIWSSRQPPHEKGYVELSYSAAFAIGVFQAIAILPGISRSGATIAAGLVMGLKRDAAATFAFLLAIPAIGGAGLLEAMEVIGGQPSSTPPGILAAGVVVSTLVGLVSLAALVRFVQRGRLAVFAWYLVPLGIAVVAWQLIG